MSEYCTCENAGSYTLVFDEEGFDWCCEVCGKGREREYNAICDLPECEVNWNVERICEQIPFLNIIDRFRWMVCTLPVVQKVVFGSNGK